MANPIDITKFDEWTRKEQIPGGHATAGVGSFSKRELLFNLDRARADDDTELIKDRFLCRGGGMLLVAPTGLGKSSLSIQLMVGFALGKEMFGMRPTRPLSSLLIQAENDEGDLAEMRDGVITGMNLTELETRQSGCLVHVVSENTQAGGEFFAVLASHLRAVKPDLVWIDPALAFIQGDSNRAEDVGVFLRRQLNPLLAEFGCAAVVVHHTPKPPIAAKGKGGGVGSSAYAGAGSAEWANWARAVLTLEPLGEGYFHLRNTKRTRLGWKDEFGNRTNFKTLKHCFGNGLFWWEEADPEKAQQAAMAQQGDGSEPAKIVLSGVSHQRPIQKDQLEEYCRKAKIGEKKFAKILRGLIEQNPPLLHEWRIKRTGGKGGRDAIFISRDPQPEDVVSMENLNQLRP